MSKIKRLSPQEAQKICAGQVVERPVNIVKELVDNAVDAGATHIAIYVEDGGKKYIRIVDNGCGMDKQDAKLCFDKHATSKITSFEQLANIETFGFRGEALASIAAVSKVTLSTKQAEQEAGIQLSTTEGVFSETTTTACPTGTDIQVTSLFYNIPAREKFLKKRETELRHINQLIQAYCFALPHIYFSLYSENKQLLSCPAVPTMLDRCRQLWDQNQSSHAIAIEQNHHKEPYSVVGIISDHQIYRFDRSQIFLFVNNRWVKNVQLGSALIRGYNNVIPTGRFPLAALSLSIDPSLVDINVHPKKEEVVFAHPRIIEKLIEDTARTALEKQLSSKIHKTVSFATPSYKMHPSPGTRFQTQHHNTPSFKPFDFDTYLSNPAQTNTIETVEKNNSDTMGTIALQDPYRLIGQYTKTYLLIEKEHGLLIIDQHAAHERILYEQFKEHFEKLPTIALLFPQIVSLTQEDNAVIEPLLPLLEKNGIAIESFGVNQLIVKSVPVHIKHINFQELLLHIIGLTKELQALDDSLLFKTINEKLHAQMACKAAVKAGDELSIEKMEKIIEDLAKTPNRFSCPHGRPTSWECTVADLEKRFKRRL